MCAASRVCTHRQSFFLLQAMDRAHRIGQTKPVLVLRLCTSDSVEVKLLRRAHSKLALERLVIKKGAFEGKGAATDDKGGTSLNAADLLDVLKGGLRLDQVRGCCCCCCCCCFSSQLSTQTSQSAARYSVAIFGLPSMQRMHQVLCGAAVRLFDARAVWLLSRRAVPSDVRCLRSFCSRGCMASCDCACTATLPHCTAALQQNELHSF